MSFIPLQAGFVLKELLSPCPGGHTQVAKSIHYSCFRKPVTKRLECWNVERCRGNQQDGTPRGGSSRILGAGTGRAPSDGAWASLGLSNHRHGYRRASLTNPRAPEPWCRVLAKKQCSGEATHGLKVVSPAHETLRARLWSGCCARTSVVVRRIVRP